MKKFDVTRAVSSIFNIFTEANTYIQKVQPWAVAKEENNNERLSIIIRNLLEAIRIGSELFYSFAPNCTKKVLNALQINEEEAFENINNFNGLKANIEIKSIDILFPRLDIQKEIEELREIANN